jgi:hypothetical protein
MCSFMFALDVYSCRIAMYDRNQELVTNRGVSVLLNLPQVASLSFLRSEDTLVQQLHILAIVY